MLKPYVCLGSIITIDDDAAAAVNKPCYLYLHCIYGTSDCIGGRIQALNLLPIDKIFLQVKLKDPPDFFINENGINGSLTAYIYGMVNTQRTFKNLAVSNSKSNILTHTVS